MASPEPSEVTQILEAIGAGDAEAKDRLFPVVYQELRRIARARMAGERADHTLQPTALVHEAYIRLLGTEKPRWENRAHFYTAAAEAMRRILVEWARRRARQKRGGGRRRVELDSAVGSYQPTSAELLALDEALTRLESLDSEMSNAVKLRYFAGLTIEETAHALRSSERTVSRLWSGARAWLYSELAGASNR
jgi:RNA polymerase sigma factor (TIGR02999 family)